MCVPRFSAVAILVLLTHLGATCEFCVSSWLGGPLSTMPVPPGCPSLCMVANCGQPVFEPVWDKNRHCYRSLSDETCSEQTRAKYYLLVPLVPFWTFFLVSAKFLGAQQLARAAGPHRIMFTLTRSLTATG